MELLTVGGDTLPIFVSKMTERPFTLLDIGCSGGISTAWRRLEPHLKAFCFDPNIGECERLQAAETNPNIEYVPTFVTGLREGQPKQDYYGRSPWDRLAINDSIAVRKARNRNLSDSEMLAENLWTETKLADPARPVHLADFLASRRIDDIDFIKIDVDGPDFEILKSLQQDILKTNVLAIGMEVNWYGSDKETDHTFHNTDRYLRSLGFDLLDVTVRRYAVSALPSPYLLPYPAQSIEGRPFQGDALYVREPLAAYNKDWDLRDPVKLNKLAAIYELFGFFDHVAELVRDRPQAFGAQSAEILDRLAQNMSLESNYADHMRRFRDDDPSIYNAGNVEPTPSASDDTDDKPVLRRRGLFERALGRLGYVKAATPDGGLG